MNNGGININAGLSSYEPGWETILEQIGIPWQVISSPPGVLRETYSCIIINSPLTDETRKSVEEYLSGGGSVLLVYENGTGLLDLKARKKHINTLPPVTGEFPTYDLLDIYSEAVLLNNNIVTAAEHGKGILAHIPFNVNKIITSADSRRKNFYAPMERLPDEVVRLRSNFTLRRLITRVLEYLHHRAGIPFINKWYYPKDAETVFTFRIDSDKGTQEEVEGLYSLSEQYDIPTTWFLDVKSHEQWLDYFTKFKRQEIGIHCYEHVTYKTEEENFLNFSRALTALNQNNLNALGIAAPQGKWNSNLNLAFQRLNFIYSSEFAYDYDNFPSFPWIGSKFSKVIQLPVHPVCTGSMRRQRYTADEMTEYFINYIKKQAALREPAALYHHPGHHYNEVFENVFRYIDELKLLKLSYSQYAEWWNKRLAVKQNLLFNPAQNLLACENSSNDEVWYRISLPDRKEIITPLKGEQLLSLLPFTEHKINLTPPADIMRTRKFDWRHIVHSTLDYWYSVKK